MKVNTPKGIRMYEGIGKSRNHGTANALANARINTKINKNPADSLSTEDYNKKYVEKKKPKKKKRGLFKRRKKMEKGGKTLKYVDSTKNPGLAKLPKEVRNKMGYMKHGGKTHKMKKAGK